MSTLPVVKYNEKDFFDYRLRVQLPQKPLAYSLYDNTVIGAIGSYNKCTINITHKILTIGLAIPQ